MLSLRQTTGLLTLFYCIGKSKHCYSITESVTENSMKPFVWREYPKKIIPSSCLETKHQRGAEVKFKWHIHDDHYEILLPVYMPGACMIGDYQGPLHACEIYLLGPGLPHSFHTMPFHRLRRVDTCQCMTIRFSVNFLPRLVAVMPEVKCLANLQREASRGIRYPSRSARNLTELIKAIIARDNNGSLATACDFLQLLEAMSKCTQRVLLASPGYIDSTRSSDTTRIDRICHYLLAHFNEPVRLAAVAEELNMSISNLCALFHKSTGTSIIAYVNQIRVGQACIRLLECDQSILEIAFATGYQNLSHFNRQFRRLKGMTPRQFRMTQALPKT